MEGGTGKEWPSPVVVKAEEGPAGGVLQVRFAYEHTSDEYVRTEAWRRATLSQCPLCSRVAGEGFSRHTAYARQQPAGAWIARYYCKPCQKTFSLLPDCIAAGLSGSLDEVEAVVVTVEQASSFENAAFELRGDAQESGRRRWVRRRVRRVRLLLGIVATLDIAALTVGPLMLSELREALATDRALVALRQMVGEHLPRLPTPLGFCRRHESAWKKSDRLQHKEGPDPPR